MANGLTRWNPFREMQTMQNVMDRFFEDWRPLMDDFPRMGNALALDVHEDDHGYVISTELPGVKPENINIRQEGDYLLIDAEIKQETTSEEGKRPIIQERRYGRFSRRLRLPQHIDFAKAEADYEDGILKLTLPKSPEQQPRTIQVKPRNGHHTNGGSNQS
jgi:HSP20 family protein